MFIIWRVALRGLGGLAPTPAQWPQPGSESSTSWGRSFCRSSCFSFAKSATMSSSSNASAIVRRCASSASASSSDSSPDTIVLGRAVSKCFGFICTTCFRLISADCLTDGDGRAPATLFHQLRLDAILGQPLRRSIVHRSAVVLQRIHRLRSDLLRRYDRFPSVHIFPHAFEASLPLDPICDRFFQRFLQRVPHLELIQLLRYTYLLLPAALPAPGVLWLLASDTDFCSDSIKLAIKFCVSEREIPAELLPPPLPVSLLPLVRCEWFELVSYASAGIFEPESSVHITAQSLDTIRLGAFQLAQIGDEMHLLIIRKLLEALQQRLQIGVG
uniref:Uncharacterized protein n=1 Tax=Anopheles melas TaxID=34690 RepID=A0A182U404_9DIPT